MIHYDTICNIPVDILLPNLCVGQFPVLFFYLFWNKTT